MKIQSFAGPVAHLIVYVVLSSSVLTNCAPTSETKKLDSLRGFAGPNTALLIEDTDGHAVVGAQVLIGDAVGSPFQNNLFTTDANGQVAIPAAWKSDATLSVSAAGFTTASFLHMSPAPGIFKIKKQNTAGTVEYSGQTVGYPPFNDTGTAHVSLVFEALDRGELANFSISKIASSQSDTISVLGSQISLPSNVSIPTQTLSYVIHINISKPEFRLPLETNSDHLMVGLHAQFPVSDLVKAESNKSSIFDMLNFFNFTSVSQQTQHIDAINVNRDIDISTTPINLKNKVQAPKFGANLVFIGISAIQQNDQLVPLDVKNMTSQGSVSLNTLSSNHASEKNITVMISSSTTAQETGVAQELMSIAVHDASLTSLPAQFALLDAPTFSSGSIDQKLPANVSGINPSGIYYSYNDVVSQTISGVLIENKTPLWDVYNPNWEENVQLPTLPTSMTGLSAKDGNSHRWTVSVLGQDDTSVSALGPDRLKAANYLTRAAVDTP